jgi:hypothetical protein
LFLQLGEARRDASLLATDDQLSFPDQGSISRSMAR